MGFKKIIAGRGIAIGVPTTSDINSQISSAVSGLATSSYVNSTIDTELASLVDSSPTTLDTLNELAAALGDDPNFATTVTNLIADKAPLASPAFSGEVDFSEATIVTANKTSGNIISHYGGTLNLNLGTDKYFINEASGANSSFTVNILSSTGNIISELNPGETVSVKLYTNHSGGYFRDISIDSVALNNQTIGWSGSYQNYPSYNRRSLYTIYMTKKYANVTSVNESWGFWVDVDQTHFEG